MSTYQKETRPDFRSWNKQPNKVINLKRKYSSIYLNASVDEN